MCIFNTVSACYSHVFIIFAAAFLPTKQQTSMDYKKIIDSIFRDVEPLRGVGSQATYIPALANVNPEQLGLCIETT